MPMLQALDWRHRQLLAESGPLKSTRSVLLVQGYLVTSSACEFGLRRLDIGQETGHRRRALQYPER